MAVAIFFVMSGYVCSIKALKLSRDGKPDEARKNIANSAFRRVIRLGLPASLATSISWFLCQIGAFEMAHSSLPEWAWLYFQSPWPSADWSTAVRDLFRALV
jgi:peptidoglycan/LPS O-acetylase OafA/YrhL